MIGSPLRGVYASRTRRWALTELVMHPATNCSHDLTFPSTHIAYLVTQQFRAFHSRVVGLYQTSSSRVCITPNVVREAWKDCRSHTTGADRVEAQDRRRAPPTLLSSPSHLGHRASRRRRRRRHHHQPPDDLVTHQRRKRKAHLHSCARTIVARPPILPCFLSRLVPME
jgi:hypothetical protein